MDLKATFFAVAAVALMVFAAGCMGGGGPSGAVAAQVAGGIDVSWSPAQGAAGYNVYRSLSSAETGTKISASPVIGVTSYADRSVSDGTTYYYTVKAVDAAGNEYGSATASATAKTAPPRGLSVTVGNGTNYTTTQSVTLQLSATGADKCRLSNDAQTWSDWSDYSQQRSWQLTSGDGEKTVYFQCRDELGNAGQSVSASVYLDTVPPTLGIASPVEGAQYSGTLNVTFTASSHVSGTLFCWGSADSGESQLGTVDSGIPVSIYAQVPAGQRTVAVHCSDGYLTTTRSVSFTMLDKPAVSLTIADGSGYVDSASVAVSVAAPQAVQCRLSNDAVTWSAWMAHAPSYQWTLSHGDGAKNVFAQCMNSGGTVSDTVEDTVILDSSPPPYISVSINNGARKVNSRDVTLGLYAFAGSRCRFANDNTVSWSAWEAYATRKSWTLSNGDGAKTVYYECQKANGADVGTATASVTLQVIPPYPPASMSIEINGGAGQTSVKTVDLALHAQGASQCRFSQDNYDWTAWADYSQYAQFTLKGGDGLKTVYYQCSNDYGTASTYSSIYLESGPPTGLSIQINGGAQYTTSQNVQLRLSATRAQQCRYMEAGYDWSAWESFRTSKAFALSPGDGRKTVSFQCRNDVGSASADASIYLLTEPPGPISDLSALAGDSYVRLSWSPPYGSSSGMIREYRVYRSTMSMGLFSRIGATGSRSYQDNNAENGETYSYYVTTVDIAGQEAHASNVVQATPGGLFGGGE